MKKNWLLFILLLLVAQLHSQTNKTTITLSQINIGVESSVTDKGDIEVKFCNIETPESSNLYSLRTKSVETFMQVFSDKLTHWIRTEEKKELNKNDTSKILASAAYLWHQLFAINKENEVAGVLKISKTVPLKGYKDSLSLLRGKLRNNTEVAIEKSGIDDFPASILDSIFNKYFTGGIIPGQKIEDRLLLDKRIFRDKIITAVIEYEQRKNGSSKANTLKNSLQATIPDTSFFRKNLHNLSTLPVKEVQIEINNGYIEMLYMVLDFDNKEQVYWLPYPVGFSSFRNFNNFKKIELINLQDQPNEKDTLNNKYPVVLLSDLLSYFPTLGVDRRDYSPKDTVIRCQGGEQITVRKEETSKLFEAHIFSDLIGLNEGSPNGLLQTEIKKRININTSVIPFKNKKSAFGFFQYITPQITISKLEQHNKYMQLMNLDSVRMSPGGNDSALFKNQHKYYGTALEIFRHQSYSAGFDLNIFKTTTHVYKLNFLFDLGGRLGFTHASEYANADSTETVQAPKFILSSLQVTPDLSVVFLPEERFSFTVANKMFIIWPLQKTFQLASFKNDNDALFKKKPNRVVNVIELLMTLRLNDKTNGKLFGRLRFNAQSDNFKNNFSQIQIGYSTNILGN